ncbi:histidine phosphatase family protein [Paenibacillus segetis]|uniref:Alpha-ribazole phosphatase n=1 Tax=Paenibacillus segetis TaxID=1325360 RepID=A0ABQ1Y5R9_9BACL|nr:histidine phosphatase family protein [Paenibacillus segetis]GGH13431.1 hypothetical protein GCM10008013_06510 [Paenibacillus segetis]
MPQNRQDKAELSVEWWLVRHGLTSWNAERRYQGHSDQHLLSGVAAGLESLRQEIRGVSFSTTYCSDLIRCQETLAYVRPDLSPTAILDDRLREMNFGQWEGQTYDMLKEDHLYRSWIDNPYKVTPPGGESWSRFHERVMSVHSELMLLSRKLVEEQQQNPVILVVTHGGVISMLSSILQPGTGFWDTKAPLGGIIRHQIRL